jgi:hypothetical protein
MLRCASSSWMGTRLCHVPMRLACGAFYEVVEL